LKKCHHLHEVKETCSKLTPPNKLTGGGRKSGEKKKKIVKKSNITAVQTCWPGLRKHKEKKKKKSNKKTCLKP